MKSYLFIGGSADGEWIVTEGVSPFRVWVPPLMPGASFVPLAYGARQEDVSITTETYIRRLFSILGRDVNVYVLEGVKPHEVADLLISKYRTL